MSAVSRFETDASAWCAYLEHNKNLSERTFSKYFLYLDRLRLFLSARELDHINCTPADLEEFSGIHQLKAGVKPASRRPIISAIRGFFGWLVATGVRSDNPSSVLVLPKIGDPDKMNMRLSDLERLLAKPDMETFIGVRDLAIMSVLSGCGLRVSGLCSLNQSDLIFERTEKGQEILTLRVREKGAKQREVPAPDETRLCIRAYLGHPDLDNIIRTLDNNDKVLFVSTMSKAVPEHQYYGEARRLRPKAINEIVIKYGRMAGLPDDILHPHAFRRLYGTELAESDVHISKMQELMGHSRPETTAVYVRLATQRLRFDNDRGNPLAKIKTPVTGLASALRAK
ncbi:MAG: tyrosine-type recombinase/integrase [Gammaproteobacteria bacterium]